MKFSTYVFSLSLLLCFTYSADAELQPGEIAILAVKSSPQSQQLAQYYAQKRGVPTKNICVVDIPKGEVLKRSDWAKVRTSIRRWIGTNRMQDSIRCFVTTWDVPLKIGKLATIDNATRRRTRLLGLERTRRIERLLQFVGDFDEIAGGTKAPVPVTVSSTLKEVTDHLSTRLRAAEERIRALGVGQQQKDAITKLTQLSVATAGLQVVTQNMARTIKDGKGTDQMKAELAVGQGRLMGLGEGQSLLDGLAPSPERDTNLIALIERSAGIVGTVQWIDNQLELLQKNETHSSFDSELSLVMESDYALLRWVPNYLHYNYDGSPLQQITRTVMVSRLEAPTFELSRKLIDTAIAVEKQGGLKGKVYLDARGTATLTDRTAGGSIPDYDKAILLADELLRKHTSLEVVLNSEAALFQPGECKDVALYCGWYSLSKYVDAFQWNPGSIGYHMASGEAATIRRADSRVWCKQMLEKGVAATLGPVYEPYQVSWPRPNEFFALLTSGRFTYIECIYRTQATNSWTMTTIGDPLYNPFKANPALKDPPAAYNRVLGIK